MSDWYYEKNGEHGGPVSGHELRAMMASGAISLTNLVWTEAFGSEWKQLGNTELAPPQSAMPPRLPGKEPPALPLKSEQAASEPNDILDSELTKALIGPKSEHYLAKWRALLTKANGDTAKVATVTSWNWPALFVPYVWLLYRKLYVLGVVVLALQLAYVLLPESVPAYVSRGFMFGYLGFCIAIALYGNSWYFDAVRKRWEALRKEPDQAAVLECARKTGGVTWVAPIGAVALVLAAAILPHVITWSDDEATIRNGFMTGYQSTTISQALAAGFDDAKWQSFTTDKGAKVVSFIGKINASLHANAVDRLMRPVRETAADSDLNVRYGSYEGLLPHYETALAYLKARNRLQPLWDKHGCEQPPGQLATCDVMVANFTLMREAVEAWADDAYWSVGEPVEIRWTINPDGRSFSLASMNSNAWKGKPFTEIFAVLYE